MKRDKKKQAGLFFMILGALAFINGIPDGIAGSLLAGAVIVIGVSLMKRAESTEEKRVGLFTFLFGILLFLPGVPFLIGFCFGAACLYWGWRMIRD
ncbi:hypothetical protein [Laceyella sacchari]|jgi:lia operon protein LiaI|uniref:DUF4190 domain-containing protein n=1 Tax=Laceyella sacchari TaxID=37482 RepID=A0ABY5U0U9_LACSH|nr:hypothetical protein [Laceyella sacchari]TCW38950.1 hypothetical protein EDC32_102190 [Laceyella sacchari]UWE03286.1 hypothetical protein NYR52_14385 [Laceyella sacchari]